VGATNGGSAGVRTLGDSMDQFLVRIGKCLPEVAGFVRAIRSLVFPRPANCPALRIRQRLGGALQTE
jgi:hypothetical protein